MFVCVSMEWTYQPKRESGKAMRDDEPNKAITKNILEDSNKNESGNGVELAEFAGKKTNVVTQILGDAQERHLLLIETHAALYHRRYAPEHVWGACEWHVPHRAHKHHPSVPHKLLHLLMHSHHLLHSPPSVTFPDSDSLYISG